MSKDILDFEEQEIKPIQANKSIYKLLLGFAGYFTIILLSTIGLRSSPDDPLLSICLLILIVVTFVLNVWGFINGAKSIRRKENSIWKKFIGFIGNFVFTLIIGLVLYANLLDVLRILL